MRDAEADDRWLDLCLHEELANQPPPDLRPVLLAADAARSAAAARSVDQALAADAASATTRRFFWLAAALLIAALSCWNVWPRPEATSTPPSFTTWIDEFHRVMPRNPVTLRIAEVRHRLAPTALPVVRTLVDLLQHDPSQPLAAAVDEFRIWAMVLGDDALTSEVERAADNGDANNRLLLVSTAIITATDAEARTAALRALTPFLHDGPSNLDSALHCLLIAADLSSDEAEQLADECHQPEVAYRFRIAAATAATDPRRLVGKTLDLAGRLRDGSEFTTANWRGDVVLACFWASWCKPSVTVMAEVAEVAQRHRDAGLRVVGISCDHDREQLAQYLSAHPEVNWPQLFDSAQPGWHELASWCGVRLIPQLFLIDRHGVLRTVDGRDDLDAWVRRLLDE